MKKIKDFFEKPKGDLLRGLLCLTASLLILLLPGAMLHAALKIAGALLIAATALRLIFTLRGGAVLPLTAINALLLLVLGVVMLILPKGMLRLILFAVGVYLLITAAGQTIRLLAVRKEARGGLWVAEVTFTVILIALGLWLLISPVGAERVTEVIAGAALAIKAAEMLCRWFGNEKKKKAAPSEIEAEFVDKSHEL